MAIKHAFVSGKADGADQSVVQPSDWNADHTIDPEDLEGIQGPPGDQGPAGDKGPAGDQGVPGAQGDQGLPGVQGAAGDQGPVGEPGAAGEPGPAGEAGAPGAPGEQGPAGDKGVTGDKGLTGDPGASGEQGIQGIQGIQGTQGIPGAQGDPGVTGDQGPVGDKGATGDPGFTLPVGSIYISVVDTNPATLFGYGTWAAFGTGRVLVGIDPADADFDAAEKTSGAKTVTLTEAQMPAHTHGENGPTSASSGALKLGIDTNASGDQATGSSTASAGSGTAHPNVQPSIVVYMWKRTA